MPRGYVGNNWIRCNAYYEFKDVPVKGRVYRYWYFRFRHHGLMRSVYCGKQRPALSPLEAVAAFREGGWKRAALAERFRESLEAEARRSLLPKPAAIESRGESRRRRAEHHRRNLVKVQVPAPVGQSLPKPRRRPGSR